MPIEISVSKVPTHKSFIDKVFEVEEIISSVPGAKFGDDACPLKHTFADGLYIREMRAPKGMLNVSKLHKTNHPFFILEGDVSIQTENGPIRIKAPHYGITKAGTKRVVYFHAETVWVTIHLNPTNTENLDELEREIIAKNYDELPEHIKESLCHS